MRSMLRRFAVLAVSGIASAQDTKDEISFNLLPNPAVVDCFVPIHSRARHATVIRGKQNDTLILDLDGIKPGLAFDLFTVPDSFFQADDTKTPNSREALVWLGIVDIKIGKQNGRRPCPDQNRFFWTISSVLIRRAPGFRQTRSISVFWF